MKNELPEDEMIRRKFAIALLSVAGLASAPTQWTAPVVNAVILPAHAQTSCTAPITDIDVLGKWRFTDQNGATLNIDFISNTELLFDDRSFPDPWFRTSDGDLILDIRSPKAQWVATVSSESDCVASEITITSAPTFTNFYLAPLIGIRD